MRKALTLGLVVSGSLWGCESGVTTPSPVVSATQSALDIAQKIPVANGNDSLGIIVVVRDASGAGIPNKGVTLSSSGSSNYLWPVTGNTDSTGTFRSSIASSRAEKKTIAAAIGEVTLTSVAMFFPGPPSGASTITAAPGSVVADGTSTLAVLVHAFDADNNAIPNQNVILASTGSKNVFNPNVGTTAADGSFTATLASTKAEDKTVTATLGNTSLQVPATFVPGAASAATSSLSTTPNVLPADGKAVSFLTVTAMDAFNNPLPGLAVNISTSMGYVAQPNGATDVAGTFSTTISSNIAGNTNVVAVIGEASLTQDITFRPLVCGSFPSYTNHAAPTPYGIGVGDFDGNGEPDLVISNGNNVSVLTNLGSGVFAAAENYPMDTGAVNIATGDFNGDGKTDIATANNNKSVSIFLSQSTGGFLLTSYPIGVFVAIPGTLATGDFDGNGKLDIIVSNNLYVLLNQGSGTFGAPSSYGTASAGVSALGVDDFNGDGYADLATVNNATNGNVTVFINNTTESFASGVTYPTDSNPRHVASADVNNDGLIDLITANGASSISVLLNVGAGVYAPQVSYPTGTVTTDIAVGDFDADGKVDVVTIGRWQYGTGTILPNQGMGVFSAARSIQAGGAQILGVVTADFNGDGNLDIATANQQNRTISVFLNACH
jgi:hypothetical protein